MKEKKKSDTSLSKGFEELTAIVREFESNDLDLERAIPKFKKGMELVRELKKRLSEIENEIEEIKKEFRDVEEELPDEAF